MNGSSDFKAAAEPQSADRTPEVHTELAEPPDPSRIELVSVTEEDLPVVETPTTVNVSPLGSCHSEEPPTDPSSDPDPARQSAPSPGMPITKVQPFISEEDLEKSWKRRLLTHRLEILVGAAVVLSAVLVLAIGLGVGLSCVGKFRCGSSSGRCVSSSYLCDGTSDCDNGEDELGCVRLSGRSSVLQVHKGRFWRTVCSEDWDNQLGVTACRQLGYSSYVESFFVPLATVEDELQSYLLSVQPGPSTLLQNLSSSSKSECSSGRVITLKCLECGLRPSFSSRIVGGNLSRAGQFPWQVSLHYHSEHLCGGSIVSSRWILTAAHCVYGFADRALWSVHVGLTELTVHGAESLAVDRIIYHDRYRPRGLDYDIALMRLNKSLEFNSLVQPICLPNTGEDFEEGTLCWISGWGATEEDGETSVVMRSAAVPLLSSRTCNQPQVYQGSFSSWMICAGYLEGGTDSCQGDSGGPLACEDSVWKLVGVTSWGIGCARRNKPGVYTRITRALDWIRKQMEREDFTSSLDQL